MASLKKAYEAAKRKKIDVIMNILAHDSDWSSDQMRVRDGLKGFSLVQLRALYNLLQEKYE